MNRTHAAQAAPGVANLLARNWLSVAQACRLYPGNRGNRSLAPSSMTRWITKGCRARNGQLVKLKATRCGSRWLIDPDDLAAFFEALADTTGPPEKTPTRPASPPRPARVERAVNELERRGA